MAGRWLGVLLVVAACGGSKGDPFVLGPSGGTIEFDNGVVIDVPAGALSEDVAFEATLLDPDETQALLDESGNHARSYVSGVDVQPSGTALAMPVTVTLPIQRTPSERGLPMHFGYDVDYHAWYPAATPTDVSIDPDAGTVSLVLDTLSPHLIAEVEEAIERFCMEEPCKCGRVSVQEMARNYDFFDAEGEDCKAAEIRGTATYHECNDGAGLTESWLFVEHSEGCVPRLTLTPEMETMMGGESRPFQARVEYVGQPYPAAELSIRSSAPSVATPSTNGVITGPDGLGTFEVMGVAPGESTIVVQGSILYRPREITINGMVQVLEERTKTVEDRSTVRVGRSPRLTIDVLGGESEPLEPGETTTVEVDVFDPDGERLPDVTVMLMTSAGSLESTSVRSLGARAATTTLVLPNEEGPVFVDAAASVTVEGVPYSLTARDIAYVGVGDAELWSGSLRVTYGVNTDFADEAQLRGAVQADFTIEYDPSAEPGSDVSGMPTTATSSLEATDGPTRTVGSCQVTDFWSDVSREPFGVDVEAAKVLDTLYLTLPRSDGDPFALIAQAQLNEREVCDAVPDEFSLGLYEFAWAAAIAAAGDEHYALTGCPPGSARCVGLAVPDPASSTTIEGTCAVGGAETCDYTLTITRP